MCPFKYYRVFEFLFLLRNNYVNLFMLVYHLFSHIIAVFQEMSVNCMVSTSCFGKITFSCLHVYTIYLRYGDGCSWFHDSLLLIWAA
jgi:hypothetical protein